MLEPHSPKPDPLHERPLQDKQDRADQPDLSLASFSPAREIFRRELPVASRPEPERPEGESPLQPASSPRQDPAAAAEKCIGKREACCSLSRNGFVESARPHIIEGRADLPTLVFYGGLAGTGWPWKEFATSLNRDCGNRAEIYSLSGHDGCWDSLLQRSHTDWVSDIIEKAEACKQQGYRPVFFGYSTSAVAAIDAAALRPDLFGALVLIGAPLELRDWRHRIGLNIVEAIDRFVPISRRLFEKIPINLPPDPPGSDPENLLAQQPVLEKIPLSVLISLVRLQRDAKAALSGVHCPVLVIQGSKDKYVDLKIAERMYKMLASEQKEFVPVPESPHAVMLSTERETVRSRIKEWFSRLRGQQDQPAGSGSAES